jgi:hypothetical protein
VIYAVLRTHCENYPDETLILATTLVYQEMEESEVDRLLDRK